MSKKTPKTDKVAELLAAIPTDREFSVGELAAKVYPDAVQPDTEGRLFNRATATVARLLRRFDGVYETRPKVFMAAPNVVERNTYVKTQEDIPDTVAALKEREVQLIEELLEIRKAQNEILLTVAEWHDTQTAEEPKEPPYLGPVFPSGVLDDLLFRVGQALPERQVIQGEYIGQFVDPFHLHRFREVFQFSKARVSRIGREVHLRVRINYNDDPV